MQLCSLYKQPTLAVKILLHMRKYKIDVNHITYSYYNKAIIEGDWPTSDRWGKLRLYINIIKAFKNSLQERQKRVAKLNNRTSNSKTKGNKLKNRKSKANAMSTNMDLNHSIKSESLASNEYSNRASTVTLQSKNVINNMSSSSKSQSVTCSLSSINDVQDKKSIDILSVDSAHSTHQKFNDDEKGFIYYFFIHFLNYFYSCNYKCSSSRK